MPAARHLPEFVSHCLDLLACVGPCSARRMFGGWGIGSEGLTFGIIADLGDGERLWLKTDATTVNDFAQAGCAPFVYLAKSKPMTLNYHSAPEEAMESPALMAPWAERALGAAIRARAQNSKKPLRTRTPQSSKATARKGRT
jgi:DNA transformation protein and related proteins